MKFNTIATIFLLLLCSCAATTPTPPVIEKAPADFRKTETEKQSGSEIKKKNLGTIAVARITIDHPLASRVFSSQVIQDSISRELVGSGRVQVIDWSRFKEVLFRRNLEWSDLIESQEGRKQIKDVLFNDYFLTGSVFSYSERIDYSSSAFSKSRSQVAEVKVDLFIKDALSNNILVSSRGTGNAAKKITQTLGFGAAGNNDSSLAHAALDQALTVSLKHLISDLENLNPAD